MKRMWKMIIGALILIIILLGAGNLYLKHYLNSDAFRTMLGEEVENATHRELTLGTINYSLFPPSIVVQDVALKEKDQSQNFISLKEFSLLVSISKREVSSIVLKEPAARIVEYADGTFNFSDMIPPPTNAATSEPTEPSTKEPVPAEPPEPEKSEPTELKEVNLPMSIALIAIENASLILVKVDKEGLEKTFTIPSLNFSIRDITLNKPIQIDLNMALGATSVLKAKSALGPLRTLPPDIANMNISMDGMFDLASFTDLEAFMTPEELKELPMTAMDFLWQGNGTLASGFTFDLTIQTPPVSEQNKLFLDLKTELAMSIPEAALNNILYGMPLPADIIRPQPPEEPQEGEECLTSDPLLALLLSTLKLQTRITTPTFAYMQNEFKDLDVDVVMNEGTVVLSPLSMKAYSGTINGHAEVGLIDYPTTYALNTFDIKNIETADIIKANPDLSDSGFVKGFTGQFDMHFDLAGQGVTTNNLRKNLQSHGQVLLANGQSVSTGGSFLDSLYLELDNPILLTALPELAPRIIEARSNQTAVSTTKLENVVFDFNMNTGTVNLTRLQVGTPDYLLESKGWVQPFDDALYLEAQINLSSNATMTLTGGKDRSDRLPYENGGLIIPLIISGSMEAPIPLPNLEAILKAMLKSEARSAISNLLNKNSEKEEGDKDDSQEDDVLQKGLNLLKGFMNNDKKHSSE